MSKIYYFLNYFYTYGEERRNHFEASFYKNYILNVYKIRYQTLKQNLFCNKLYIYVLNIS